MASPLYCSVTMLWTWSLVRPLRTHLCSWTSLAATPFLAASFLPSGVDTELSSPQEDTREAILKRSDAENVWLGTSPFLRGQGGDSIGWQGEALGLLLHCSAAWSPYRPSTSPSVTPNFPWPLLHCLLNCHHAPLPNSGPYSRIIRSSTFHSFPHPPNTCTK